MIEDPVDTQGAIAVCTGGLNVVAPVGFPSRGGSAARASIVIWEDRLAVIPSGVRRGIFRQRVILKAGWKEVYPLRRMALPARIFSYPISRARDGLVLERKVEQPRAAIFDYQFFPRDRSVQEILEILESAGYLVGRTPRRAKYVG